MVISLEYIASPFSLVPIAILNLASLVAFKSSTNLLSLFKDTEEVAFAGSASFFTSNL